MYIEREIQPVVNAYRRQFKSVLVTGARQVGKTTMLKHDLPASFDYVSLDNLEMLARIKDDSALFFIEHDLPLVIDEVQYAPELFMRVKRIVDASDKKGQIILTGSQTYQLMHGVSESLAGRVGILEMSSLSLREITGRLKHKPYVPILIDSKKAKVEQPAQDTASNPFDLWGHIQRGSMPELADMGVDTYAYYSSYVRTYIERDVRELVKVRDERRFYDFMVACAARTGQLLNASDIAATVGADTATIQGWISALQASGIVHVLRPFFTNTSKRLAKTPKLYFLDTGLACHLAAWNSPEALRRGAMAGHMFETFVVSEVLKSYMNAGHDLRDVSFYRDARKREIDLVIQEGDVLHPVEIKTAASVKSDAIKNFKALEELGGFTVGFGSVICQTEEPYLLAENVQAIPVWAI